MKEEKDLTGSMCNRRDFLTISGLSGGALALGGLFPIPFSYAKEIYPAKKITWLIGNPPGGGADTSSRAVAPFFEKYLKALSPSADNVGVVITNLVGADGLRAMNKLYQSKPDGYTLMGTNEKLFNWAIGGKVNFDVSEITLIGRLASAGKILAANKKTNLHTWDDIVKESKRAPVDITFAGFGTSGHMTVMFLIEATKLAAKPVVAPSTSGSVAALLRGDVPLGIFPVDLLRNLVEAKEVRPILLFTESGTMGYSGVPSAKDVGFPELMEVTNSQRFIIAPPKLPANIKKTLQDTLVKAMADKNFLAFIEKARLGMAPLFGPKFDMLFKDNYNNIKSKEKLIREYLK